MADGQAGGRTAAPRHPDYGKEIEPGRIWDRARLEVPSGQHNQLVNQPLKPYGARARRAAAHGTAVA